MLLSSGEDAGTGPGARSIVAILNDVEVRPGHAPPVEDAGGTAAKIAPRGDAREAASHVSSRLRVLRQCAILAEAWWQFDPRAARSPAGASPC
jgi:hypothetical protein